MSCEYCKDLNGSLMSGCEGEFFIDTRTFGAAAGPHKEPILRYVASDEIFSTDVEIDDNIVIRFCPMCGEELA